MGTDHSPPVLPRGIRNNNPGNIRLSATRWQGQRSFQFDPAFVEFISPVFGLRAMMRLLLTYHCKYGLDCVAAIINRYAPPYENATDAYIHQVARRLRVTRDQPVNLLHATTLTTLAQAITVHENGRAHRGYPPDWYDHTVYVQACDKAMQSLKTKEKA